MNGQPTKPSEPLSKEERVADYRGAVELLFDAAILASQAIHRADEEHQRVEQLRARAKRECGNCDHWMQSRVCPIDDQRRGFPGHSHVPCGKYTPTRDALAAAQELAK